MLLWYFCRDSLVNLKWSNGVELGSLKQWSNQKNLMLKRVLTMFSSLYTIFICCKLFMEASYFIIGLYCRKLSAKKLCLLRELRHPNILQFLGATVHGEEMILITEFLSGVCIWHSRILSVLISLFHIVFQEINRSQKFSFCFILHHLFIWLIGAGC